MLDWALISTESSTVSFNLENCSVTYFAGYLAHCSIKKFHCNTCKINLVKSDETLSDKLEMMIVNKNFKTANESKINYLKRPTEGLLRVIFRASEIYNSVFGANYYKRNTSIKQTIIEAVMNDTLIKSWVAGNCTEHKKFILEHSTYVQLNRQVISVEKSDKSYKRKLKTLTT